MKGVIARLRELLRPTPPRADQKPLPRRLADQQVEHDKAIRRANRAVAELRALESAARRQ